MSILQIAFGIDVMELKKKRVDTHPKSRYPGKVSIYQLSSTLLFLFPALLFQYYPQDK